MCSNSPTSHIYIPPSYYIQLAKPTLSLFTGLTRSDLAILNHLYHINCQSSFGLLYKSIAYTVPYSTFQLALHNCLVNLWISRAQHLNRVYYQITSHGIDLVERFNNAIEAKALEQYNRYH